MRRRRPSMCPNSECSAHMQPVRLLGGCGECGRALVPYLPQFVEPTTLQLARFAVTMYGAFMDGQVNIELLVSLLDGDSDVARASRANVRRKWKATQQALYDEAWAR